MTWFFPHLVTVPLLVLLALIAEFIRSFDNMDCWWSHMAEGKGSLPAARIGPAFLTFVIVIFLSLIASLLRIFTLAGLAGLFKGLSLGLTIGSLADVALLSGRSEHSLFLTTRLWAGYGAMGSLGFCLWVGLFNPLLSKLGKNPTDGPGFWGTVKIYAISGPIMLTLSALIGLLKYSFF